MDLLLGSDLAFGEALDLQHPEESKYLGDILRCLTNNIQEGGWLDFEAWKPYISQILMRKDFFLSNSQSPLLEFFCECAYRLENKMSQNLEKYLSYLLECGADLTAYGAWEYGNFRTDDFVIIEDFGGHKDPFVWRITAFYYGPRVEDWIWFVAHDEEYEWAGEFWEWTENPELFGIPGAYPHWHED